MWTTSQLFLQNAGQTSVSVFNNIHLGFDAKLGIISTWSPKCGLLCLKRQFTVADKKKKGRGGQECRVRLIILLCDSVTTYMVQNSERMSPQKCSNIQISGLNHSRPKMFQRQNITFLQGEKKKKHTCLENDQFDFLINRKHIKEM